VNYHLPQQVHTPDTHQDAQLCTPTTSNDLESTNHSPNSYFELRYEEIRGASMATTMSRHFGSVPPEAQTSSPTMGSNTLQKGQQSRAKNRVAASKFRQKSKKYIHDLKIRERGLANDRRKLMADVATLTDQVLELKHEILRHGNCKCEIIQRYLVSAAQNITGISPGS
jgi:hypothetical protein